MSKYELYVNLVLEMCEKLEKTDLKNLDDPLVWDATLMRFQVLGENLKKIPIKLKEQYPETNWRDFEWFRNQVSHEYKIVLKGVVRDLIKNLNYLKGSINQIKLSLKEEKH